MLLGRRSARLQGLTLTLKSIWRYPRRIRIGSILVPVKGSPRRHMCLWGQDDHSSPSTTLASRHRPRLHEFWALGVADENGRLGSTGTSKSVQRRAPLIAHSIDRPTGSCIAHHFPYKSLISPCRDIKDGDDTLSYLGSTD
jgi:hypothetical protein